MKIAVTKNGIVGMRDYRVFLRRELKCRQTDNPTYSQRAFARDLGLLPHRLSEILKGKQGISPEVGKEVARRLKLNPEEATYFVDLVQMRHARSLVRRDDAKGRVEVRAPQEDYKLLDLAIFQVLSDWLPFAILELAKTAAFRPQVDWVADRFGVDAARVSTAVTHLQRVGLLKITDKTWVSTVSSTLTDRGVPSHAVKNFHRLMIAKSEKALFNQPMEHREFSSLILAIDERRIPELKACLKRFAQETNSQFGKDPSPSLVASVSMQMHLLTPLRTLIPGSDT